MLMPCPRTKRRREPHGGLRSIVSLVLLLSAGAAFAQAIDEDAMKGLYIYKFIKFVEWPATRLGPAEDPFHICVAGDERINALAKELDQKSIRGKKVVLVNLAKQPSSKDCQIVFVSVNETWRLKDILAQLSGQPTLTVSDAPNFVKHGGMIGFVFDGDHLSFEINQAAALRAQLSISAQLLSLAKAVIR